MKRLLALLICAAAIVPSTAQAAPWNGVYDSFTYQQSYPRLFPSDWERFGEVRAAGGNVVLNYGSFQMSIADNVRYARAAEAAGVRVIYGVHNYLPGQGPGLKWKLRLLKNTQNLPSTLGYYVGDEVTPGTDEERRMRKLTAVFENRTKRLTVYTATPVIDDVRAHLGMADVLCVDPYPVGHPAGVGLDYVGEVAQWSSELIRSAGDKPCMVLQLFSWADYGVPGAPWPTPEEIAAMRWYADTGYPRIVLWWSFYNVTDRQTLDYWRSVAPFLVP